MEMDLSKLPLPALPPDEQKFVRALQGVSRVFYSLQFLGEQAVNTVLAHTHESWNRYANVAILRVGSGGRLEGGAMGSTELIVLTKSAQSDSDFPTEQLVNIAPVLQRPVPITDVNPVNPLGQQFARIKDVEHRPLESSEPLSYYPNVDTPYPGRILEAEFIAGNQSLWHEARIRVLAEVSTDAKIVKGMRAEAKKYGKTCESGLIRFRGETYTQFDTARNQLFYDPPNNQSALKYGPVRYGHTALAIEIFTFLSRRRIAPTTVADLPQGVEERCRYCLRQGWVADVDRMTTMALAYSKALDAQTQAKAHFEMSGTKQYLLPGGTIRSVVDDLLLSFNSSLLKP